MSNTTTTIRNTLYLVLLLLTPFTLSANEEVSQFKETSSQAIQLIDINTADTQTLTTLKGIGKSKAQAIILYRETNGRFKSVDELLQIKGIGKKVLMENKAILKI